MDVPLVLEGGGRMVDLSCQISVRLSPLSTTGNSIVLPLLET